MQIYSETNTAPCKLVSRLRNKLKIERGMQKWPEISLKYVCFLQFTDEEQTCFLRNVYYGYLPTGIALGLECMFSVLSKHTHNCLRTRANVNVYSTVIFYKSQSKPNRD